MEGGVTVEFKTPEFKDDPGILENMRFCLGAMARLKNVKLEHPLKEYDMDTMLNIFEEMEPMPLYYSPRERLIKFKDKIIIFFANIAMWILRGVIFLLAKAGCEPAKVEIEELRKTHDKYRKE